MIFNLGEFLVSSIKQKAAVKVEVEVEDWDEDFNDQDIIIPLEIQEQSSMIKIENQHMKLFDLHLSGYN